MYESFYIVDFCAIFVLAIVIFLIGLVIYFDTKSDFKKNVTPICDNNFCRQLDDKLINFMIKMV